MQDFFFDADVHSAWKKLSKFDDSIERLLQFAAKLYDTGEERIKVSEIEAFQKIEEFNFFIVEDECERFPDQYTYHYVLAHYFIRHQLLDAWNEKEKFVQLFKDIGWQKYEFKERQEIWGICMVLLHNDYGKNVCQFLSELDTELDSRIFWPINESFNNALPYLKLDVAELVNVLSIILDFIKGDMMGGGIYFGIKKLARYQPDISKNLLSVLKGKPDEKVASFIVSIFVGLSETDDFESIFNETIELLQEENKSLIRYAILSLGRFNYENNQKQLEQGLENIEPYVDDERPEIESAVANAYSNLFKFDSKATDKIVRLSESENQQTQQEIANFLYNRFKGSREEEWYKETLFNLTSFEDRFYYIDSILRQLVDNDNILISEYLDRWLESSDYSFHTETKITEVFHSTFIAMVESENGLLDTLITNWLNTENKKCHIAVKHICQMQEYTPKLDPHILKTFSTPDLKYINMKVMGYLGEGETLCRLVFSMLQVTGRENEIQDIVAGAFIEYIAYNYPGGSRKYLEQKKKEGTEVERQTAERILDWLNSYFDKLSTLPKLTEFEPPAQRLKYYYFMMRSVDRELRESVDKSSPFLSMIQKVDLKGGKRSFTKVNGQYTEKTPLGKISTSWEPPQGEFKNPVEQAYLRYIWRTIKKDDVKNGDI